MSKYVVNSIDEVKNHVNFTVTFDDGKTFTETKGDLPLDGKEAFTEALEAYVKEVSAAHDVEVEAQTQTASFKAQVVGKEVTVADDAKTQ